MINISGVKEARMAKKIKIPLTSIAPNRNFGDRQNQHVKQMEDILKKYHSLFRSAKENGLMIYLLHKNCSQEFSESLLLHLPTPDLYDLMRICKNQSSEKIEGLECNEVHDRILKFLQRARG